MPNLDGAQVQIDPDAIDEHARSLEATWEQLVRIDNRLRSVEQWIQDDSDDSGFGAFMRAQMFWTQHKQLFESLKASLDATLNTVDATAQGARRMAAQYRQMEGANLDTMRPGEV
jgi:hypothetical protein